MSRSYASWYRNQPISSRKRGSDKSGSNVAEEVWNGDATGISRYKHMHDDLGERSACGGSVLARSPRAYECEFRGNLLTLMHGWLTGSKPTGDKLKGDEFQRCYRLRWQPPQIDLHVAATISVKLGQPANGPGGRCSRTTLTGNALVPRRSCIWSFSSAGRGNAG
jgi:hypothetical protein